MPNLRVLVVEDSITIRAWLCDVLASEPGVEVVGTAEDGRAAVERCVALRPDVVTLDMALPVMSGLAATEQIMSLCPTPILVVSASTNRGELFQTWQALAAGAVDVLEKPRATDPDGVWERRFLAAVRMVSRIPVITHPRARLHGLNQARPAPARRSYDLIAIGVSTGGPAALVEVLRAIPAPSSVPIAIVLHIDEVFGSVFAEWLDSQTAHRVAFARDGEVVASTAGRVTIAPPGAHLVVADGRFRVTSAPPRHSCRPSVDELFRSVADAYGATAVGCLLTGMGRDGAAGLLQIRRAGGRTIAQDEASSVVYGMPREALMLGAVDHGVGLARIGPMLAAFTGTSAAGAP